MGLEALCRVRYGEQISQGKALLETSELLFRGDFRLRIPFREISLLESDERELSVGYGDGVAIFELGANAAKWAEKIRNPRGLMDKLGVKPGIRVSVLGGVDEDFLAQLRDRTSAVSEGSLQPDSGLVFYEADDLDDLMRLPELRDSISHRGAVWVVSPKGKGAKVKDVDVMAAARDAGLVDTKVVAFSGTHTALKLVIPVARRSRA